MPHDTLPLSVSANHRAEHVRILKEVTALPSAAGREGRVVEWIERYLQERPHLVKSVDASGNITVRHRDEPATGSPVYFTAHMDHPAFVVERIIAPGVVELSFRGGVMDEYFPDAAIVIHDSHGQAHKGRLFGEAVTGPSAGGGPSPFKHYLAEYSTEHQSGSEAPGSGVGLGDVAVWDVGPAEVIDGILHTLACDDLSALAAAVCAFDILPLPKLPHPVRLLFTRSEEIGFIGAIGACRDKTLPKDARILALENSRSFAESPIGGGPIVRVGDRLSVFSPSLTAAVAKRAEDLAGGPSMVTASQKLSELSSWRWQRKLMAGGACESSVFCAFDYEATCICLPLGNYHNMEHLQEVQAGTFTGKPRAAREFISISDFEGLVDLLVACGTSLPKGGPSPMERFEKLWKDRRWVLSGT